MKNDTRLKFTAYLERQAELNGVASASHQFNVAPSVQQTLENKIQESSTFLKSIQILPVDEIKGEKLGIGTEGPIASRTNTDAKDRDTRDMAALDGQGYEAIQTNYDTHVKYGTLDAWAKFKDFQVRLSRAIQNQCALDRIMIGFNGVSAAATTDRVANPLLQDVNKGWLQYLREFANARVMSEGKAAGKIVIGNGPGADYKTLDGAVFDAVASLIEPWHRGSGDLVAIVGRDLMHDKMFPLVDGQTAPTEMLAASIVRSQRRLGDLPAISVPFMRPSSILITSLSNLAIYYQSGSRRRHVVENPRRNRIETYESSNDAYVLEDLGKSCLLENIEIQE